MLLVMNLLEFAGRTIAMDRGVSRYRSIIISRIEIGKLKLLWQCTRFPQMVYKNFKLGLFCRLGGSVV